MNRMHDRCDKCQAQAFVEWGKVAVNDDTNEPFTRTLQFCIHHSNKYKVALVSQGFDIITDDSDKINTKPSISANAE